LGKIKITEEQDVHKEWYKEAKKMTLESLPEFLRKLTEDYGHDYGTICHAMAAAAISAASAINHSSTGGITGFQAGAVMWEFIRNWNYSHNKTGLRIIDYDNMLYPQYAYRFNKLLSPDIWESLKKEASTNIKEADLAREKYFADCIRYEKDLAAFILRHPDYPENPKRYEKIGFGTGTEWEEQRAKEDAGFDFAPSKPYCLMDEDSPVYKHWRSIVNGQVPFGFIVGEG
jgi:hypothetical protein